LVEVTVKEHCVSFEPGVRTPLNWSGGGVTAAVTADPNSGCAAPESVMIPANGLTAMA
jgi:hypothetical protein